MKPKITEACCVYTGGGIYVYFAKYGDYFLYGTFNNYIGCYSINPVFLFCDYHLGDWLNITDEELESFEFEGCDCDYYIDSSVIKYPTWRDILKSIKPLNNHDAEETLVDWNPNLSKRVDED